MRVVIIGSSGDVGTYLVPRLVEAGYEVINITRGQSKPYLCHAAWEKVRSVIATHTLTTQSNHLLASLCTCIKLEWLRKATHSTTLRLKPNCN
jgi:nucleoside-diphosphate-sugar epimerase